MKKSLQILLFLLFTLVANNYGQSKENWVSIYTDEEKILYINVTGLSSFQNDEVMVWVMEEISKGFKMEEISEEIYKMKSYYMINKSLKRYSLVDVIYYNEKGNVIKNYHYTHDFDNPEFKYTTPILHGSEMERIYAKCLEVINTTPASN